MKAMFTMMNNARLGVGVQGIGQAEAAYQNALTYALGRKQGKVLHKGGSDAIVDHADVRRMLTTMKADIFTARSIALSCAVALDMAKATGAESWRSRAAFLTPLAKAFGTDTGIRVAETAMQVHGGMGFIEDAGAAQYCRDVRITAIYEGTNGIQAMDLVARKLADNGEAAFQILDEVEALAESGRSHLPELASKVWDAAETLREATEWLITQTDLNDRFAGAVAYLKAFSRVLGAHFHLKAALSASGTDKHLALARFYILRMLPEHASLLAEMQVGADGLFDLSLQDLA
jgi:acyl-CoA dehydrogenase